MSLTARKVVDSSSVYQFLEDSIYEVYNSLLADNQFVSFSQSADKYFQIFKTQSDFDGSLQVNTYAEDDDKQKINFGILRFIGGEVDSNKLMNVYVQRYAVEFLSFEEFRADIRTLLTTFSSSINGDTFQISDGSNTSFTIFVSTQAFPDMSETIDANGVEKFLSSIVVEFLFYQDIIHSRDIVVKLEGVQIPYTEMTFTRQMVEPAPDLRKTYEHKFIPTKTSSGVNISGLYQKNSATSKIMDFILKEEALETTLRLYYNDGEKVRTGRYIVTEAKSNMPYNAVSSYAIGLIPAMEQNYPKTHSGLLVQNGAGSDEYAIGSEVTITFQKPVVTPPAGATLVTANTYNTSVNAPIPTDIFFKPDGTVMYIINDGTAAENKVASYNLSTAWNPSTATFADEFSFQAQSLQANDVFFKPDGTKMYVLSGDNDRIYQYTLSTPWSVTTAVYDSKSLNLSSKELNPQAMFFNSDGTSVYIIGTSAKKISKWNLNVAWDVSTGTFIQESAAFSSMASPNGLFFSPDGTKLYLVDSNALDKLFYYVLPEAFDLSDIRLHSQINVQANPQGIYLKADGTRIYLTDRTAPARVYEYFMAMPFVLSPTSRDLLSFEFEGITLFDLVYEGSTLLDLDTNGSNETQEFEYSFTMPSNDVRIKIL